MPAVQRCSMHRSSSLERLSQVSRRETRARDRAAAHRGRGGGRGRRSQDVEAPGSGAPGGRARHVRAGPAQGATRPLAGLPAPRGGPLGKNRRRGAPRGRRAGARARGAASKSRARSVRAGFVRRLAATPWPPYAAEKSRGDAVAATWICRGEESRGRDVDMPRRRAAATPWPPYAAEKSRGDAVAATWIRRGGEPRAPTSAVRRDPRTRRYSAQTGLAGRALVFLGGAAHDVGAPTFSVHALLKAVRAEAASLRSLAALDVLAEGDDAAARRAAVLRLAAPDPREARAAPPTRVDLLSGSKGAVAYANNLEKDAAYARPARPSGLVFSGTARFGERSPRAALRRENDATAFSKPAKSHRNAAGTPAGPRRCSSSSTRRGS